ncbi:MAG: OmpH family outer membrane protein [Erysipelotrichia bacterium]|nr:OmpH family outer membrane protein [Erysipelotrichia bacterium]
MKKYLINLSALVLLLSIFSAPAFCQAKDQVLFGFTNVSQAMMLHPTMANFLVKEGRFSPKASKEARPSTEKLKEFETKRNKLLAEKKNLEEQLDKEDRDLSNALSALNVKFNSKSKDSSPNKPSDEYNKEKNSLENKFWVQRREVQIKLSGLENSLVKINQENELLHLTSNEETERIFKVMLDDIFEAVNMVSKHYNVSFVFNSSFSAERTPVNPSFTPINPMGEFFSSNFKQDANEVLYEHGEEGRAPLSMTLGYWVACQRWAFRNTVDSRLDQVILKGGLDMTPAVVDYVYQKHNVSPAHREIIQEFLKKQNTQQ